MLPDTPFTADLRALLAKHGITAPRFAHGARAFDPAKPQVLYSGPVYGVEEMLAGCAALVEGKWSVAGEYVRRFETAFSSYLGQKASVMVNSGSTADLLMVAAAKATYGWKDGDGIIVSPVGFPTTISAITLNGLTPVFVDIEWDTLNADNDLIERALQQSAADVARARAYTVPGVRYCFSHPVRAILVSPVLGNPPDMDRLTQLVDRYGVKLLLDGCDSLGSLWRGKHLSDYAAASSCSFFPAHHISTLQGGMISSNDEQLIETARSMGAWGKGCWCSGVGNMAPNGCCGKRFSAWLPDQPDLILDHRYVFTTDRAYNTQPLELQGALGLAQMDRMDAIHEARRKAWWRLDQMVFTTLDAHTAFKHSQANPSWFGYSLICPTQAYKEALVAHLEAAGIQTRHAFGGHILRQPGYRHLGRAEDYPKADEVLRRVFFLGTNPCWSNEHFAHIEATLKSFTPPSAS